MHFVNLKDVIFLGDSICLHRKSFDKCNNLVIVEFTNASKTHIHKDTFADQSGIQVLKISKKRIIH